MLQIFSNLLLYYFFMGFSTFCLQQFDLNADLINKILYFMNKTSQSVSMPFPNSINCQNYKIFELQDLKSLNFIEQNLKKQCLLYENYKTYPLQRYTVQIDHQDAKTLAIYEWRRSTDLPIVKTYYVDFRNNCGNTNSLHVYNQSYQFKLSQLSNIPFNQMIYILKESIIGFERLLYRFGPFDIVPEMICINSSGHCKVWMNPQFQQNKINPIDISETEFARKLIRIMSQKVQQKNVSINFFKEIEQISNMIEMLDYINEYIKIKKIKVPSKFDQTSYADLRKTVKRTLNINLKSCSRVIKEYKSLQKINKVQRQIDSQENVTKLTFEPILKPKIKKLIFSSNNFNTSSIIVQKQKTLKTSSNSTNSYTFKSKLNISNQHDQNFDQPSNESKLRKRSQNILTNSYQIFDDNEPQSYIQEAKKWKNDINLSQKIAKNIKSIKQVFDQTGAVEEKSQLVSDKQSQDQQLNTEQIFRKNGWENKIDGIFGISPLKESVRIGKDENLANTEYQFKILKPPGLVYESILPEDFE